MNDERPVGERSESPAAPVQKKRHPLRSVLLVIVAAELVIALLTAGGVVFAYSRLDSNIETLPPIPHQVSKPKVEGPKKPLNILVMGSDTRAGRGNHIDGESEDGARSDTTMLLHVSADRQTAYGVSLARDTMVDRPQCKVDGRVIPAAKDRIFNEAFTVGGPLCTAQQVEALTGVYIDHTVVVDFNGFKDMVDAVHGVQVCIPFDVDDPKHNIELAAGTRLVSGQEALNYVRERHVLSVNSDIGRMKRQQAFVASMVSRVTSAGTLTSPKRLYDFLDAATASIQVDEQLDSIGEMYDLARELKDTDLQHIRFATVPIEAYAPDPNRLQFAPDARKLWKSIRRDQPLGTFSKGSVKASDKVGKPTDDGQSAAAQERRSNGLCA